MLSRRLAEFFCFLVLLAPAIASEREPRERRERERADRPSDPGEDCLQFNCQSQPSTVTRDNVGELTLAWRAKLADIADGAPVYLSNALTLIGERDLLIVSTMGGHVIALDSESGEVIWHADPPAGPRWTTASPAVDPNRTYVYAYGLDGYVHRYSIFDGGE